MTIFLVVILSFANIISTNPLFLYAEGEETYTETTDPTGETPEWTPEPLPEETPEWTPEPTPEETPEWTPEPTPEVSEEPLPEETPEPTPESTEEIEEVGEEKPVEYLAFTQSATVDDVVVTVSAPEGVFPENATLSVEKVEIQTQQAVEAAIEETRENEVTVVTSYTFDIKILDVEGNGIQPTDGSKVKVTFAMAEVTNDNLFTNVYHVSDTEEITPEAIQQLEVETEGEEAIVESESFSLYTVEFIYGSFEYVLEGNATVKLRKILDKLELSGNIESVEVSNPSLFNVNKDSDDEYVVTAIQAFTSTEWMKVTLDGIEYVITVKDTINIDNSAQVIQAGYEQGGSSNLSGGDSFVKDLPIQSIHIKDLSTINPVVQIINKSGNLVNSVPNGTANANWFTSSGVSTTTPPVNSTDGNSASLKGGLGENAHAVGMSSSYTGTRNINGTYLYRYRDAAILPDGTTKDVIVVFSEIKMHNSGGWLSFSSAPNGGYPSLTAWTKSDASRAYGLQADIVVRVVDSGTINDISTSELINPNYFYTVRGIDISRAGVSTYSNLPNRGAYSNPPEHNGTARPNYTYSESVDPDLSTFGSTIYFPKQEETSLFLSDYSNDFKRFVASGNPSDDSSNPGPDSYGTGFAALGNVNGTKVTAYSASSSNDGQANYRGINFMTPVSHSITASTGQNGKIDLWDDGVAYSDTQTPPATTNKLMDGVRYEEDPITSLQKTNTYSVPNGKEVTYKLIPDREHRLRTLRVNGSLVNAVPRDADGNIVADGANVAYYTYTFEAKVVTDQVLEVEWRSSQKECEDCKNLEACENCYLALGGSSLIGYSNTIDGVTVDGVYRGKNARSGVTGNASQPYFPSESDMNVNFDTFAEPLPYGSVYIDSSKLKWNNANLGNFKIDIKDSRFKFVGTGKTEVPGSPSETGTMYNTPDSNADFDQLTFDADLVGLSDLEGSSLMLVTPTIAYYGPLHSYLMYGTEETDGKLGNYPMDNTAASTSKIANGTYTTTEGSVNVVNGTNVIETTGSDPYLYRVTYKDAAVLQDGSRGDLVLTVTKVELETNYTTPGNAYIGLQRENEMQVGPYFVKEGVQPDLTSTETRNRAKYIPGNISNPGGAKTIRDAVGAKTTFDIQVLRSDGTPVEGIISYAVNDLDLGSFESVWGRQPSDTFADHGGSESDATKNAWTDTYEFYEYSEGMKIESGALSYALIPNYNHAHETSYNLGQLPINEYLDLKGYTKLEGPIKVLGTGSNSLANGVRFVSSASGKIRNNDGQFQNSNVDLASNGDLDIKGQEFRAMRNDNTTYDTGFAVLLNAAGSQMTWTGSAHANGTVNTTLFDTKFVQYLHLSHGTGGGIYVEDYELFDQCKAIYRENLVTMPYGSSVKTTIVPEDGYRVNKFTIDDIVVTVEYDDNDNPKSLIFTKHDGSKEEVLFNGSSITKSLSSQWDAANNRYLASFYATITKNDDGIIDIDLFNRSYVMSNGVPVTSRHNIHADFDTDYYFTKVWVDAASVDATDQPRSLTFTASPYIMQHNSVTVNDGTTFEIQVENTMHLDALNANLEKYKDNNNHTIRFDIDPDGIVLTISGNRQRYPTFELTPKTEKGGTVIGEGGKYVIIGSDIFKLNAAGDDIDTSLHPFVDGKPTNPFVPVRGGDGYYVKLPDNNFQVAFLLHHVTESTYTDSNDPTNVATTTDNPEYNDVVYVTIASRPQKPYSKITLNGVTYAITGVNLHEIYQDPSGEWKEDTSKAPIPISCDFKRYNYGTYINKKTFTVRTGEDVGAGTATAAQLEQASKQAKYITTEYINNGQDLVWKIKYPSHGLDVDGDGKITNNGVDWPALSIETEHIYDAMHEINTDHVERLYWFTNERLGTLTGKWALDGYSNNAAKVDDLYAANSEVPGYASYRDSNGNIKYNETYWYLLSTEDRNEVSSELGTMADLRMAFMSPISSETVKRSSYGSQYGVSYYTNWGGMIVNSIRQTKLRIEKQWIGGDHSERTPFKLTINREYDYSQISHKNAVTQGQTVVTLPNGSLLRDALLTQLNGDPTLLRRLRNGPEPLDINKETAIEFTGDTSVLDPSRLIKIKNGTFDHTSEGETKEAWVYIWFDDVDDGTMYIWTDADQVYLPEDSSGMFANFPNLELISGVHNLNASEVTNMSRMFAVDTPDTGKITNLYNLREWDVGNVIDFSEMFLNQTGLQRIHGVIDWDLTKGDIYTGMFKNTPFADGTTHPFIWYPNVYIGTDGTPKTPEGRDLDHSHSQNPDGTARDLVWNSEDLTHMATWWNNGKNTPTNYGENDQNLIWTWDVMEENLSYSDATKWTYRVFEDKLAGYTNVENALSLGGAIELQYNPLTGKWEAYLTNIKTTDVHVKKETTDNEEGIFKFRIKFNSLFDPNEIPDVPRKNTIVVTKRFTDAEGNYLDLSEDPNDYIYEQGNEYKLTLWSDGAGSDHDQYQNSVEGTAFPVGWTKLENGMWSYTFEGIDDEIPGYLVEESAIAKFRYKEDTELSEFKTLDGASNTAIVNQDRTSGDYHTASFYNTSTAGEKAVLQKSTDPNLAQKIQLTYKRNNGMLLERYVSFDGEQYDTYDVLIGVDENEQPIYVDGRLKDFHVYYGGVDNGVEVTQQYPYEIYTDDEDGGDSPIDIITKPTYDPATHTVTYVDAYGHHTITPTNHVLKRTDDLGFVEVNYQVARDNPYIDETKYPFADASDTHTKYLYDDTDSKWKKYVNGSYVEDVTEPPLDSSARINLKYTVKVWDRGVSNHSPDPKYQTSGTYTVTDPATGVSEEYYIVEKHGESIGASHQIDTNLTDLDVISSIKFDAEDGSAKFTTADGTEYKFTDTELTIQPNVWEFTLTNGQEIKIPNIPLGTTYEVWEYDLEDDWSLIKRETKKVEGGDPTSGNTDDYEGGEDPDTIKKYSLQYVEDSNGTYYQLIESFEQTDPAGHEDEFERYTDDMSVLVTYRKSGYIPNQNGKYYKLKADGSFTTTKPTEQTANDYVGYDGTNLSSITRYKESFVEDNSSNGTYYRRIYTITPPTADTAYNYVGYDGQDPLSATKYKKDYVESDTGTYYKKKDGTYVHELPVGDTIKTSTGNGGLKRFIGLEEELRHIFTNEKDTFKLKVDKTVTGNQGSKDQYFKFVIKLSNIEPGKVLTLHPTEYTTVFSYKIVEDGEEGEWYRLKNGLYTKTAPTTQTASSYVGYTTDEDLSTITKYKEIKPNVATEFMNYFISNENNRDDDINMTYKEAKNAALITETDYVYHDKTDADIIYIYETDHWVEYKKDYVHNPNDNSGKWYHLISPTDEFTEVEPDSSTASNYEGYDGTNLSSIYRYKYGYVGTTVSEPPMDAEYKGQTGQQIVVNDDGEATVTVYMKHAEALTISGLPKGTEFEIEEIIEGLKDYLTTITDGNGKNKITGRETSGVIGEVVEENENGLFYQVKGTDTYERLDKYYADYIAIDDGDINKLPKYSITYSQRPHGTYYIKDYEYTTEAPTVATKWHYDEYVENPSDPNDLSSIKAYRQDFVEDENGTFYRYVNDQGKDVYTEVSPSERYDLTTKYTLNVAKKYTNTKDGVVPTKAFAGIILPILALMTISLMIRIYMKKKKEELAEFDE